jgi:hypothetical protein
MGVVTVENACGFGVDGRPNHLSGHGQASDTMTGIQQREHHQWMLAASLVLTAAVGLVAVGVWRRDPNAVVVGAATLLLAGGALANWLSD